MSLFFGSDTFILTPKMANTFDKIDATADVDDFAFAAIRANGGTGFRAGARGVGL